MKKGLILLAVAVISFWVVFATNVVRNKSANWDLLQANIEALANGVSGSIPWARYSCQTSAGNCCIKQGLYSGEQKLA